MEKRLGGVAFGLALTVFAIIMMRRYDADWWLFAIAVLGGLAFCVIIFVPTKDKNKNAPEKKKQDDKENKENEKAKAVAAAKPKKKKKVYDWFWWKVIGSAATIGAVGYFFIWPWIQETRLYEALAKSTESGYTLRPPKHRVIPTLHKATIYSGKLYRFEPKDGPIYAQFYDFKIPIRFRFRQTDGTGSWKTLKPGQNEGYTYWAYLPDESGPHPTGLPLELEIAKCPRGKRQCSTYLKILNNVR